MKVLVTGAAGFVGSAVVDAARAVGHDVVALVRPTSTLADRDGVTIVHGDLRQRGAWRDELADVASVIHLAAAAEGGLPEQFVGTVTGTEHLLDALDWSSLQRFVHVSSFSVYDFEALETGDVLDESAAIEATPERRDAYTTTKILQERLVREACRDHDVELVVVRPGKIFGPGKDWMFGAAMRLPVGHLVFAPGATMPLTYVGNCADALVRAVDAPGAAGTTVNLVDDDLPTHREYFDLCRDAGAHVHRAIGVPWWLVRTAAGAAGTIDRWRFGGNARLPELVSARRQEARWRPLSYPNDAAKRTLGWAPSVPMREAIRRTIAEGPTA